MQERGESCGKEIGIGINLDDIIIAEEFPWGCLSPEWLDMFIYSAGAKFCIEPSVCKATEKRLAGKQQLREPALKQAPKN